MKINALLTYRFAKNVGPIDRVFRIVSGFGLAGAGWALDWPLWTSIPLTILGLAWAATGFASRCGIYYMFGLSTSAAGGPPDHAREPGV